MDGRTRRSFPQINEQDTRSGIGSDMNDLDLNIRSSEDINRDAINRLKSQAKTQQEILEKRKTT